MAVSTQDEDIRPKEIQLTGRLITSIPGVAVGENFTKLSNLRYTDASKRSIRGMTKINTSVMNSTYLKPRSSFHFKKFQPSESHLLVQAYNSGLTQGVVLVNDTAIPNQGNFNSSPVWTDMAGSGKGHFSDAPGGQVIYTNGQECVIWGGYESKLGAFIHYKNTDSTVVEDYSDQLRNTLTNPDQIALLNLVGSGYPIDSNTVLLLHCDGTNGSTTFTDSGVNNHAVTSNGGAALDTGTVKFGTASGKFNGTTAYLSTPANADFNFSGGNWTIDLWCKLTSIPVGSGGNGFTIYYQQTDANNYISIQVVTNGDINLAIVSAGANVVNLQTNAGGSALNTSVFKHVAIEENGNTYSIYIDGVLKASTSSANRAASYTGAVQIGAISSSSGLYNGWMDEYRVSNVSRYTNNFSPPSAAYGSSASGATSFYIGATRTIEAFKPYVGVANTNLSVMAVYYWNGNQWVAVTSLVDGTSVGGVSLAQTGTVTFASTESGSGGGNLAVVKEINGTFLYWYKVEIVNAVIATTTLTYLTVRTSWQVLKDIWDGKQRPEAAFFFDKATIFNDFSPNVFQDSYDSSNTATFASISALTANTDYLYVGFTERVMGIVVHIVNGQANPVANTSLIVQYWNGTAWTNVTGLNDGTSTNNMSFSKGGIISWNPPSISSDLKYTLLGFTALPPGPSYNVPGGTYYPDASGIPGGVPTTFGGQFFPSGTLGRASQNALPPLFFYRLSFTQSFSCQIYYVAGVSRPNPPLGHAYSFLADNRQWLCNETGNDRNSVLICSSNATDVWNGDDSIKLFFGSEEDVTCGAALYIRTADTFTTIKVIFKNDEMHGVSGLTPPTYQQFQISPTIGCPAPETLRVVKWRNGWALIWQGSSGIYLFDGTVPIDISGEIKDLFRDGKISSAKIKDSVGFVDVLNQEYHWLFSTDGVSLNNEYVYDLDRSQPAEGINKWYVISRGTGLQIQTGCSAIDTQANPYTFGGIDTGYIERLEYGQTLDGQGITSLFEFGDIALNGILWETEIQRIKLITVEKVNTANLIQVTYFPDTSSTSVATLTMSPVRSGYTTADAMQSIKKGNYIFHRLNFSMTTTNEDIGFEPIFVGLWWKLIRKDFKGGVHG